MDYIVREFLDAGISLSAAQDLFLDAYVAAALRRADDDITAAALALSTHRNTLHNIIRRRPAVLASMQRKQRRVVSSTYRTVEELRAEHQKEKSGKGRKRWQR